MGSHAPMTVSSNGQQIASDLPPQHPGFTQNLPGGLIHGAAAKTASSIAAQASHAKALGATMRGSGRRKKKYKGGSTVEFHPVSMAEGNSIPGVSASKNMGSLLESVNGLKTGAVYDHLVGTQPYKVKIGGRRNRSRKTRKHGRRNSRARNRNTSKRSHRRNRNRSRI